MIKIEKGKEPKSWTTHRLTPGAVYEATDDLRDALLADQGYKTATATAIKVTSLSRSPRSARKTSTRYHIRTTALFQVLTAISTKTWMRLSTSTIHS